VTRLTYKYRLYPTKAQVLALEGNLMLCCELYNAALQERRDAYRIERKSIQLSSQNRQLPKIKEDRAELNSVYAQVLQDVLRRVDKAFVHFFRRVRLKQKAGYPRFHSKRRYDSMTYPQGGFSINGRHLKLSKIGNVKIKLHRVLEGKIKTLTIKRQAGKWFAYFCVEINPLPLQLSHDAIGIDVGLSSFATLSNGEEIRNPRYYKKSQAKLRCAQRKVSRRKNKSSHRRFKAVMILQHVHLHIGMQRLNFHHEESRRLINRYGLIAIEALNIQGLARSMLAKSVYDVGWSSFISLLVYKAENAGRVLEKVDPRGTSQTCVCGTRVTKTLADRWHYCSYCGLTGPRDHIAAQVILSRARTEPSGVNVEVVNSCVA